MAIFEARTTQVSLFGRFADALTRYSIQPSEFGITLDNSDITPIVKHDGSFAFLGLEPRSIPYTLKVQGQAYRTRLISADFMTPGPKSLARDGEDELYVTVKTVNPGQKKITFDSIPFLPGIHAEAAVIGQGGFTATLQDQIEGEDVSFAALSTVTGLAPGNVLRIIRSERLLLRAGPYYRFEEPATVLSIRVLDNSPSANSVAGAQVTLNKINGVAITTVSVGGVDLYRFQLSGDPVILGPVSAVESLSNPRGEVLFDFPGHLSITNLELQVNHPGFVPLSQTVAVTAGEVTRWTPQLAPV